MGCGGGADMIRNGLWERVKEGKKDQRERKDGNGTRLVRSSRIWASSCTAAALLRTAIPYSNKPINHRQQLTACDGSACFYLLRGSAKPGLTFKPSISADGTSNIGQLPP